MVTFEQLADECYRLNGYNIRADKTRSYELVLNRMAIGNIMTRELKRSTVEVGRKMGVHHTTVVHYRNEHYGRYRYDQQYKTLYDKLCNFILSSPNERYQLDNVITWIRSLSAGLHSATFCTENDSIVCG
jgi:hypothetical protein